MKIQRKIIVPTFLLALCIAGTVAYNIWQSLASKQAYFLMLTGEIQTVQNQRVQLATDLQTKQQSDINPSQGDIESTVFSLLTAILSQSPTALADITTYQQQLADQTHKLAAIAQTLKINKKDKKALDDLTPWLTASKNLDVSMQSIQQESPFTSYITLIQTDYTHPTSEQMMILVGIVMILLVLLMASNIVRLIKRPLAIFDAQAAEIASGIFSKRISGIDCEEVDQLGHSFNVLVNRVEHYDDDVLKSVDQKTKSMRFETQRITGIFEGTTDWISAIDTDFRFIAFNSVYAREFQRRYGKKIMRNMHLLDEAYGEYPKGREKARELWGRALAGEQFSVIEQMGDEGVGIFWYEMSYNPLKDETGKILGASQIVRDITDRRRQEDLLRRAKDRIEEESQNTKKFQLAVEYSTDAIQIAMPDMTVAYVNPAWEHLTGYKQAEILSQKMTVLHSDSTPISILEAMNTAIALGNDYHTEDLISKRKDGSEFNAEITFFPVRREGKVQLFVGILNDITHRKKLEQAQSEFVSLASHQLRTPLTAVRLAIGALQRGEAGSVSDEAGAMLKRSMEYVVHMSETIHTMLNISRLEAGKLTISPHEIVLNDILTEVTSDYVLECQRRHQVVEQICDPQLKITTDVPLIKEAVSNLFGNAIKYTPDSGKVSIKVEVVGSRVHIMVTDTGYGIPEHQQEKIFSKFFRAENVLKKETSGTGLGLYLVHSIVQLIGGVVSFTSKENEGTTFTIDLPLLPPTL